MELPRKKNYTFFQKCKLYLFIMLSIIIINNASIVLFSYKNFDDISLSQFNEELNKYVSMAIKTGDKIVNYNLKCEDIPIFLNDERIINSQAFNTKILGISWQNKDTTCYSNSLFFNKEGVSEHEDNQKKTVIRFIEEDIFKIKILSIKQSVFNKNNIFIGVLNYKISSESFSQKIKNLKNINNSLIKLHFKIDSNSSISLDKSISIINIIYKMILDICKFLLIPLGFTVFIYFIVYKDINLELEELKSINIKMNKNKKEEYLALQSMKQQRFFEKKVLRNIFFSLSEIIKNIEYSLTETNNIEQNLLRLEEIYKILVNVISVKTNNNNANNSSNINDIIKTACEINYEKSLIKKVSISMQNNKELVANRNDLRLTQIFSGVISYILDTSANGASIDIKIEQELSKIKVLFEEKDSFMLGINKNSCKEPENDFCKLALPSWKTTKRILEIEKIDVVSGFCHLKKGKYIYLIIENENNDNLIDESGAINVVQFPK